MDNGTRSEAEAQLRKGLRASEEGRLEIAAEALTQAEMLFRNLHDMVHVAECRAALGEVQRQSGALRKATASYEEAIKLYHEHNLTLREASATLALGHVERARGRLDLAQHTYRRAITLFTEAGECCTGLRPCCPAERAS
jgi:tetratricopeptide (TPR) repeat protein